MKIKLFVLAIIIMVFALAQEVHLGNVHVGNQTFGTTGSAPPAPPADSIGAEWYMSIYPDSQPIGGGHGYTDTIIRKASSGKYTLVTTLSGLETALSAASDDDTIYVDDTCHINCNSVNWLVIADEITLASGRGKPSGDSAMLGALIYVDSVGPDWTQPAMIYVNDKNARITGLRVRGSYSEYDQSYPRTDSFRFYPIADYEEYGIWMNADSCEIDNCDISGFGRNATNTTDQAGVYIHNNYIHHQGKYYSYSLYTGQGSRVIYAANLIDHYGIHGLNASGDSTGQQIARFNIFTSHGAALERHQANQRCPDDYYHHNTFMAVELGVGNAIRQSGATSNDTVFIHNNWCWAADSSKSFQIECDKARTYDNSFTATMPDGLGALIPTAAITVINAADSGNAPFVCSLSAFTSSDPDGTLKEFYWDFGDSLAADNVDYMITGDTVIHTYDTIGLYLITLMVKDDHGCVNWDYDTIKVKPTGSNQYLTFWESDCSPDPNTGYWEKQCWINKTNSSYDWKCWSEDIAGNNSWQQVIIDITDTLTTWAQDSFTLCFRLYCNRDSTAWWSKEFLIDDVHVFGGTVINGNAETPTTTVWAGTGWSVEEVNCGYMSVGASNQHLHSGRRGLYIGDWNNTAIEVTDYARIYQRVDDTER